ncbi:MAG: hypothetical protein C4345_05670, partial [Chloroflexota bacterium]
MALHEPHAIAPDLRTEPFDAPEQASRARTRKGGLGRGLGALIPASPADEPGPASLEVDINAISP